MPDLRHRFGALLKGHRKRRGLTQEGLADRCGLSVDMVTRLEAGNTGASFKSIEALAGALSIDPAELFFAGAGTAALSSRALADITSALASLEPEKLEWLRGVIAAALEGKA